MKPNCESCLCANLQHGDESLQALAAQCCHGMNPTSLDVNSQCPWPGHSGMGPCTPNMYHYITQQLFMTLKPSCHSDGLHLHVRMWSELVQALWTTIHVDRGIFTDRKIAIVPICEKFSCELISPTKNYLQAFPKKLIRNIFIQKMLNEISRSTVYCSEIIHEGKYGYTHVHVVYIYYSTAYVPKIYMYTDINSITNSKVLVSKQAKHRKNAASLISAQTGWMVVGWCLVLYLLSWNKDTFDEHCPAFSLLIKLQWVSFVKWPPCHLVMGKVTPFSDDILPLKYEKQK